MQLSIEASASPAPPAWPCVRRMGHVGGTASDVDRDAAPAAAMFTARPQVIAYCQIGMRASVDLLALHLLGYDGLRDYCGAWEPPSAPACLERNIQPDVRLFLTAFRPRGLPRSTRVSCATRALRPRAPRKYSKIKRLSRVSTLRARRRFAVAAHLLHLVVQRNLDRCASRKFSRPRPIAWSETYARERQVCLRRP